MRIGEKLEKRPFGMLNVCAVAPDQDGWSWTLLENQHGERFVKHARNATCSDTEEEWFRAEEDEPVE